LNSTAEISASNLSYSGARECARRGLEGIVAKRKDASYRSGPRCGWVKVKTAVWRAANQYRAKLFERR
jgi:ATP-dependent DNA ligase